MQPAAPVRILCALVAAAGARPLPAQEPPYEAVLFSRDVMVPMRDGVRPATDIYRPTRGGAPVAERLPVLLQRTPYGKDARGLVEQALWFARLPYADGRVGMWGTSYGAHTQADAAKMAPPALKALLLNFGGLSNGWRVKVRNHGAFELAQQMGWAFTEAGADHPESAAALAAEPVERWFWAAPLRRGLSPLALAPDFEEYFLEEQTHADYDDYLKRSPMRLLMGPWVHGGNARPFAGDVSFGPEAALPDFARRCTWRGSTCGSSGGRLPRRRGLRCASSSWARGTAARTPMSRPPRTPTTRAIRCPPSAARSPGRAELLTPGQVYELDIEPFPTANVFKKGHRIHHDARRASYVVLPIAPSGR